MNLLNNTLKQGPDIINYIFVFVLAIFLNSCSTPQNTVPRVPSNETNYITLQDNISSKPRYLNGQNLKIVYQENYNDQDGKLTYNIYNQKQSVIQSSLSHSVSVSYGLNKLSIPVNNLSSGMYILEVINEKGVKKYLTFLKSI